MKLFSDADRLRYRSSRKYSCVIVFKKVMTTKFSSHSKIPVTMSDTKRSDLEICQNERSALSTSNANSKCTLKRKRNRQDIIAIPNLLIHGYVRRFETKQIKMSGDIKQICIHYFGTWLMHETALSLEEISNLEIGDIIDHRDPNGRFYEARVKMVMGSQIRIGYEGRAKKYDVWSDYEEEPARFAKLKSITQRPAHRFLALVPGNFVDINPKGSGWKWGQIRNRCPCSGQIEVAFYSTFSNAESDNDSVIQKGQLYWVHLDDTNEIAEFTSKAGTVVFVNTDHQQPNPLKPHKLKAFKKIQRVLAHDDLRWTLKEICGADREGMYKCLATKIYGDSKREHVDVVKCQCKDYLERKRKELSERSTTAHDILRAASDIYRVRIRLILYTGLEVADYGEEYDEENGSWTFMSVGLSKFSQALFGIVEKMTDEEWALDPHKRKRIDADLIGSPAKRIKVIQKLL